MKPNETQSAILAGAGEHVAQHGLHKGSAFAFDSEAACTLGAFHRSQTRTIARSGVDERSVRHDIADAYAVLLKTFEEEIGLGAGSIPDWNDAPERTAEDVILLFKKAANHE